MGLIVSTNGMIPRQKTIKEFPVAEHSDHDYGPVQTHAPVLALAAVCFLVLMGLGVGVWNTADDSHDAMSEHTETH